MRLRLRLAWRLRRGPRTEESDAHQGPADEARPSVREEEQDRGVKLEVDGGEALDAGEHRARDDGEGQAAREGPGDRLDDPGATRERVLALPDDLLQQLAPRLRPADRRRDVNKGAGDLELRDPAFGRHHLDPLQEVVDLRVARRQRIDV